MLPSRPRRGNSRVNRSGRLPRGPVAQLNKPLLTLAILAGIAFTVIYGLKAVGPSFTPPGKHSLATLDASHMAAFEAQFDAASDSTRLLVLLSPT